MQQQNSKVYSYDEFSKHKQLSDCWVMVHGKVYDVSSFVEEHPGGPEVLLAVAGEDATMSFEDVGHSDSARKILQGFYIGEIDANTIPTKRVYVKPKLPAYSPEKTGEFTVKLLQLLLPLLLLGIGYAVQLYSNKT